MVANSVWYTVTSVFVAFVALAGMGIMFVRGTNIERNALVGGLTFLSAAIAGIVLYYSGSNRIDSMGLFVIAFFSLTGYFLGRALDRFLGGSRHSKDTRNSTLGADLAD